LPTLVQTLNLWSNGTTETSCRSPSASAASTPMCGFINGEGALKGRFLEGVHRAARATVCERNTPGMTMAELARVAPTKGDERLWLRLEQLKERTKEREVLAKEAQIRRQARADALSQVTGGTRGYQPRDAPVWAVGAVGAPTPGARYDVARPGAPGGSTPGAGDNSRHRSRPRDESSRLKRRAGEYPCW